MEKTTRSFKSLFLIWNVTSDKSYLGGWYRMDSREFQSIYASISGIKMV